VTLVVLVGRLAQDERTSTALDRAGTGPAPPSRRGRRPTYSTSRLSNALRERSTSDTVRARVCPQHPPGEDSREGPRVVRDTPQRTGSKSRSGCCRFIGRVSAAGAMSASGSERTVCSAGAGASSLCRSTTLFGFRDVLPAAERSVQLPVRRNGRRSLLRATRNVEIRTFFYLPRAT